MNEEQKEWSKKYTASIATKEFLRIGCAIMLWVFLGAALALASDLAGYSWGPIIFGVFLMMMFIFPFAAPSSKAMYPLLRKILGNENLPTKSMPRSTVKIRREPLPWWGYLLGIWHWVMILFILFIVLKWYFR
ncbi:MAG TPA: hypothetical protein VK206_21020 [Anaerolineales bacterium]|nr:hypothetical protein [Anaerolineales bacterium]HLO29270.1 hypothetical protein [Anaerolineales bacterium]